MLRIRCGACHKAFEWDETGELEPDGGLARPREQGARQIVVWCPRCHAGNKLWVKGLRKDLVIAEAVEEVGEAGADGAH